MLKMLCHLFIEICDRYNLYLHTIPSAKRLIGDYIGSLSYEQGRGSLPSGIYFMSYTRCRKAQNDMLKMVCHLFIEICDRYNLYLHTISSAKRLIGDYIGS